MLNESPEAQSAGRIVPREVEGELDGLALWTPAEKDIPVIAAALSWPGFTPEELAEAWEAFREAVEWREALGAGERFWVERFSEDDLPPGEGPTDAAIKLACAIADKARSRLLSGGPR